MEALGHDNASCVRGRRHGLESLFPLPPEESLGTPVPQHRFLKGDLAEVLPAPEGCCKVSLRKYRQEKDAKLKHHRGRVLSKVVLLSIFLRDMLQGHAVVSFSQGDENPTFNV